MQNCKSPSAIVSRISLGVLWTSSNMSSLSEPAQKTPRRVPASRSGPQIRQALQKDSEGQMASTNTLAKAEQRPQRRDGRRRRTTTSRQSLSGQSALGQSPIPLVECRSYPRTGAALATWECHQPRTG